MVNRLGGPVNWVGWSLRGSSVLARLMESQIWHPPGGSVRVGGLRKKTMASAHFSVWEKTVAQLPSDTSVSPCTTLLPFNFLPQCWSSEGVSLNKLMYVFLKGNCLGLQNFLPLTQSHWFLQPEVIQTYLPGTGTLGWGAWCGARTTHLWDIPPEFLFTTCGSGTNLFLIFAPPTSVDGYGLFHSCQTSIQLNFCRFWVMAVYILVVI